MLLLGGIRHAYAARSNSRSPSGVTFALVLASGKQLDRLGS